MLRRILTPFHLHESLNDFDWPLSPAEIASATHVDVEPGDVVDRPASADGWASMWPIQLAVRSAVAGAVRAGDTPVVLSGDCVTALGTVAGLQSAGVDPAIVWFDAHGDVQTMETTTSGYLGGMPLRILLGYRPELISEPLELRAVAQDRAVLVDARDLDPPERVYLAQAAVRQVSVPHLSTMDLPDGPIYLHLDVDVARADLVPGLRFPAGGGPDLAEVFSAARAIWATGRVAAVGVGCTWYPGHGSGELLRPYLASVVT